MNASRPWTYEELDTLYNEYYTSPIKDLAEKLNRTVQSVESKAMKMYLRKDTNFTSHEMSVAKTFGSTLGSATMFLLPECSVPELGVLFKCVENA